MQLLKTNVMNLFSCCSYTEPKVIPSKLNSKKSESKVSFESSISKDYEIKDIKVRTIKVLGIAERLQIQIEAERLEIKRGFLD